MGKVYIRDELKYKVADELSIVDVLAYLHENNMSVVIDEQGEPRLYDGVAEDKYYEDRFQSNLTNGSIARARRMLDGYVKQRYKGDEFGTIDVKWGDLSDDEDVLSQYNKRERTELSNIENPETECEFVSQLAESQGLSTGELYHTLTVTQDGILGMVDFNGFRYLVGMNHVTAISSNGQYKSTFSDLEITQRVSEVDGIEFDPISFSEFRNILKRSNLPIENTKESTYKISHDLLQREKLKHSEMSGG